MLRDKFEIVSDLYLHTGYVRGMIRRVSQILDTVRRAVQTSDKTRYRLSQETGIPQSQLSRLMTGEKGLSFDAMERLVAALGLEIVIRPKKAGRRQRKGR
jgi:predicted XRE-type DNA-binding protein